MSLQAELRVLADAARQVADELAARENTAPVEGMPYSEWLRTLARTTKDSLTPLERNGLAKAAYRVAELEDINASFAAIGCYTPLSSTSVVDMRPISLDCGTCLPCRARKLRGP